MSDWIDNIRIRFENEVPPPIEDDWDYFESYYLRNKGTRSVALWTLFAVAAAAASLLLFLFNNENNRTIPDTPPSTELISSDFIPLDQIHEEITTIGKNGNSLKETNPDQVAIIHNQTIENESFPEELNHESDEISPETQDTAMVLIEETRLFPDNQNKVQRRRFAIAPFMKSMGVNNKESVWGQSGLSSPTIPSGIASNSIPYSFGLNISMAINDKVAVTGGSEISIYHSRITINNISNVQNAYYLGIPLRLDWTMWQNGPVSVWIGGGGKVDRLVYGKFGSDRVKDNTLNWSIVGDLGIQYDLSKNVGLFLSPEVSYFFKPENPVLQTYRTENPLMFTVGAGLRFSL